MSNAAIVEIDGDTPDANAAIESAKTMSQICGAQKVYGINDGMQGLLRAREMPYSAIEKDLTGRPINTSHFQCVLSTSTTRSWELNDPDGNPYTPETAAKRIEETLANIGNGVDKLIVISGIRGIFDFREIAKHLDIDWTYIAKSMNCDIGRRNPNSDQPYDPLYSLGYATAATVAKYKAAMASSGAHNQHRVTWFENLGRISGFPGAATQASDADFALLPEMFRYYELSLDDVIDDLADIIYHRHSGMRAVVGSSTEAVPTTDEDLGKLLEAYDDLSKYTSVPLKGKVLFYIEKIKERLAEMNHYVGKITPADITHDCRWAFPTEIGIYLAKLYGKAAARKVFSNSSDDKGVTPVLTFDKLLNVGPEELLEDITQTDRDPRLITSSDLDYLKADDATIQIVPPEYLGKYKITQVFLDVLHRLTMTKMKRYIPEPEI